MTGPRVPSPAAPAHGPGDPAASWAPPHSMAEAGSKEVARARLSFLGGDAVPASAVRNTILASWERSRQWEVRPDCLELPVEGPVAPDSILVRAAKPVLTAVAESFATEPVSVILCDAAGLVLSRLTGDSGLERHLNRVWLAPGFSYAEQYVGTNGIGTALEGRRAVQVFGHEHFVENLEELACAGVPIRHPVSGKMMGVVDLTCWRRDAGALMVATAGTLARSIELVLLQQSGRGELAVLGDYLVACKRSRGAVLAVGEDLLVMNDRARELLEPADQVPLLAEAREALAGGLRQSLLLNLPSGRTARVHCHPTTGTRGVVGGVLDVQLTDRSPIPAGRRSLSPLTAGQSVAVGSSAIWRSCLEAADRHLQAAEWPLLAGEPGSGRETVVRAVHQARTPAARLRVLRAEDAGPGWVATVSEELAAGAGTLVLTDIDRLPPDVMVDLADALEPLRESTCADRPWVAATVSPIAGEPCPELAALLLAFPRTLDVPPLRRHVEDLTELVPHLIRRLSRGSTLRCSPEVMRVLLHNRWPGNVDQCVSVLRRIIAKRRSGTVEPADLPAECWATGKRILTPLESLECDAIIQSLLESRGNKLQAARRLSMSRATIYRKVRDYGIVLPDLVRSGRGVERSE